MEPSVLSSDTPAPELQTFQCSCGAPVPPGGGVFERGQWTCRACAAARAPRAAEPPVAATVRQGSFLGAVLGGLAGALAGAAVFAAVVVATDAEIGYLAVLVGFLAGGGVRLAARGGVPDAAPLVAGALAIFGLVASKFMVLGTVAVQHGVSPLDARVFSLFVDHFADSLSPFDALWAVLAVGAAMRAVRGPGRGR